MMVGGSFALRAVARSARHDRRRVLPHSARRFGRLSGVTIISHSVRCRFATVYRPSDGCSDGVSPTGIVTTASPPLSACEAAFRRRYTATPLGRKLPTARRRRYNTAIHHTQ